MSTKPTLASLSADVAALTEAVATLATVVAAQAAAPAAPAASSTAKPFPFAPTHPCTADGGCGRMLRTAERASKHGHGGHSDSRK